MAREKVGSWKVCEKGEVEMSRYAIHRWRDDYTPQTGREAHVFINNVILHLRQRREVHVIFERDWWDAYEILLARSTEISIDNLKEVAA